MNYYHPKRVQAQPNPEEYKIPWMPDQYFKEYEWPERRMNPYRGWEIFPKAIYDIAMIVKEEYGNIPWFISENGMGVENEVASLEKMELSMMCIVLNFTKNISLGYIKRLKKVVVVLDIIHGLLLIAGLGIMRTRIATDLFL